MTQPLSPDELRHAIDGCLGADRHRLRRALAAATGKKHAGRRGRKSPSIEAVARDIEHSRAVRKRRSERSLRIEFPPELPISQHVDEIKRYLESHQVLVVAGETGSGKSTQLPKICLDLGRGIDGMVAHTQPRRLAARTLATRIASELDTRVGDAVGYRVRFTDETSDDTAVKLLTDGMLLAEAGNDRFLNQYDTIIVDEAHERSLNIDFLLGILKQLLQKRPELKLIITSATIDTDRLAQHFDNAPVVEVSGRMFPVEVRYRSGDDSDDRNRSLAAAELELPARVHGALEEILADGPGDVLTFLPGEREIRECSEYLSRRVDASIDVLPLYSRLSRSEQDKVFRTGPRRRVVLATNVAETSVTVPGIRYVIDSGLARISRYSPGRKLNRLPVERISQASAEQRKGRCGRIASGVCIRLYSEEDFIGRSEYTDPEIQRSSLADVILRMLDMRLGDIEVFPFVDAPASKQVRDGYRLLEELGAINPSRRLTRVGSQLARLPVDPRLGRMLIAGAETGCLDDVLTVAAALAIADPRVTPFDRQNKARQQHRLLDDERSDFLSLVRIRDSWQQVSRSESKRAGRRFCEAHYLSYPRMLEWEDLRRQLRAAVRELGMEKQSPSIANEPCDVPGVGPEDNARADALHQALLTGLLGNVAQHLEGREYQAARSLRVAVHPSTALGKKRPKWLMSAEMLETSALFARTLAPVRPQWIEHAAGNLVTRSYSAPRWHKRRGCVMGVEKVSLFGLTLVASRPVDFGKVRPREARQVFIQEALVGGDLGRNLDFVQHNAALLEDVEAKEDRFRRRDLRVDDFALYSFYDERLPDDVYTAAGLERWWQKTRREHPEFLHFDTALVQRLDPGAGARADFPQKWVHGDITLALEYLFLPGDPADGVTAVVPMDFLNQLDVGWFDALVPGLLRDKLISLVRALPKAERTRLVPAPDTVDAVLEDLDPHTRALATDFSRQIQRHAGVTIAPDAWPFDALESHLMMRFRLVDSDGKTVAEGRDLGQLKNEWAGEAATSFRSSARFAIERDNVVRWDFGELPESCSIDVAGRALIGFPALVEDGDACAIRVFDSPEKARQLYVDGLRRLLLLELPGLRRMLEKKLPDIDRLCLAYSSVGSCASLKSDIGRAAFDRAIGDAGYSIRTAEAFADVKQRLKTELPRASAGICSGLAGILEAWRDANTQLNQEKTRLPQEIVDDIRAQLDGLVYTGFVADTPTRWFDELPRFLLGVRERLDRAISDPARDRKRLHSILPALEQYREDPESIIGREVRWMIEELRVSVFAQGLGTSMPISVRRIEKYREKNR